MSLVGIALLLALAVVYAFAVGIYYSRKRCPHCGHNGVTPHADHDPRGETSRVVTCDHCGLEV